MADLKKLIPVPGSEREPLPGASISGAVDPNEVILVTVLVRRAAAASLADSLTELSTQLPHERQHLTREEFARRYGADSADLEKIEEFAHEHELSVVEASAAKHLVVLSGPVAAFSKALGVHLARYDHPGGSYRGRTGPVYVPDDLAPIVEGVLGLDNRPIAKPHFRCQSAEAMGAHAASSTYTPPQVAKLYDFPTGVNGSGQCIAIIELGGGYRTSDLKAYFASLGISAPKINSKSVDGGTNHPTGNPNGPDVEVMLDIEVSGAVAPGAKIVVYFAPNTDAGFLDAITSAIHDNVNKPSAISISWGAAEKNWTAQAMQAMDKAFQAAAALGVTVCCAAGDGGSADGETDGLAHADFPAASPYALACGGTKLIGSGSTISSETVWNEGAVHGATGGGVSDQFGLPAWQAGLGVPPSVNPGGRIGRGVPDVSGDADPVTGYIVRVDGQIFPVGGTSAVAPLWAGLIALLNQKLGHAVGYLNPLLYKLAASAKAFHDIATGNNGAYAARAGWDACTGLGTPDGAKLAAALSPPAPADMTDSSTPAL